MGESNRTALSRLPFHYLGEGSADIFSQQFGRGGGCVTRCVSTRNTDSRGSVPVSRVAEWPPAPSTAPLSDIFSLAYAPEPPFGPFLACLPAMRRSSGFEQRFS